MQNLPETSLLANETVDKETLKNRIIEALYQNLQGVGNAEQIAKALGLPDHVPVNRRLSDLEKEERVIKLPYAKQNEGGSLAYLYRLPHITSITLRVA